MSIIVAATEAVFCLSVCLICVPILIPPCTCSPQQVYQQLQDSLLDKLHAVQQDMAATPSSQLEQLRQQLQVVQLLHQTLESVQGPA